MADTAQQKQPQRGPGRPFRPGQSGNPRGKPPGSRSRITLMAERLMEDDAGEIVKAVVKAAKKGDMAAARLILERIAPVRKGRPVRLSIPAVRTASDVAAAMAAVAIAMANGNVTPEEALTVASVFEMRRKALETEEFEQRLRRSKRGDWNGESARTLDAWNYSKQNRRGATPTRAISNR